MEKDEYSDIVGKHVNWFHVGGKGLGYTNKGFGVAILLAEKSALFITGDCGITTSAVKKITRHDKGITVETQNSTYNVEPWTHK